MRNGFRYVTPVEALPSLPGDPYSDNANKSTLPKFSSSSSVYYVFEKIKAVATEWDLFRNTFKDGNLRTDNWILYSSNDYSCYYFVPYLVTEYGHKFKLKPGRLKNVSGTIVNCPNDEFQILTFSVHRSYDAFLRNLVAFQSESWSYSSDPFIKIEQGLSPDNVTAFSGTTITGLNWISGNNHVMGYYEYSLWYNHGMAPLSTDVNLSYTDTSINFKSSKPVYKYRGSEPVSWSLIKNA